MLEMSRRVGGAESRCQAQSVGHAHTRLAQWGPRPFFYFCWKEQKKAHF